MRTGAELSYKLGYLITEGLFCPVCLVIPMSWMYKNFSYYSQFRSGHGYYLY